MNSPNSTSSNIRTVLSDLESMERIMTGGTLSVDVCNYLEQAAVVTVENASSSELKTKLGSRTSCAKYLLDSCVLANVAVIKGKRSVKGQDQSSDDDKMSPVKHPRTSAFIELQSHSGPYDVGLLSVNEDQTIQNENKSVRYVSNTSAFIGEIFSTAQTWLLNAAVPFTTGQQILGQRNPKENEDVFWYRLMDMYGNYLDKNVAKIKISVFETVMDLIKKVLDKHYPENDGKYDDGTEAYAPFPEDWNVHDRKELESDPDYEVYIKLRPTKPLPKGSPLFKFPRKMCRSGGYFVIIKGHLPELNPLHQFIGTNQAERVNPDDSTAISSSKDSWRIDFIFHLTIIELLLRIWTVCTDFNKAKFIAPLISLFQSSGWGKSRSIVGLAETKLCDVLYLCCRESGSSGYPLQSPIFQSMKRKLKVLANSCQTNRYHWQLFAPALYAVASAHYETLLMKGNVNELVGILILDGSSDVNVAVELENEMCLLYDKYADLPYNEALTRLINIHREFLKENIRFNFNDDFQRALKKNGKDSYEAYVINQFLQKFNFFPSRPIVFVFDEARTLSKETLLPGYSMNRVILQILRETPRHDMAIVAISIDTYLTLSDLSSNEKFDPAFRSEITSAQGQFRPVHDMHTVDLYGDDGIDLELLSFERLFSLGRPLWGAFIRGSATIVDKKDTIFNLVLLAERKLLCGLGKLDLTNEAMCIAMLASRMALSFTGRSELNEKLVAHHMANCRYISEARDWIQICYQSEPLLAEAAAQQWYKNYPDDLLAIVQQMRMAVDRKQIEWGVKGDDVAKFLLLLARDKNATLMNSVITRGSLYSHPISVRDFMRNLAGDAVLNFAQIPDLLLNGKITFTHFLQMNSTIDKNVLKRLWRRHCAAQAPKGTPGYDILIPVVIEKDNVTFITYILVQVTNYSETTAESGLDEARKYSMSRGYLFPNATKDPADPKTPYLCIYMQLGPHNPKTSTISVVTSSANLRKPDAPTGQYCMNMSGLSTSIYPCLLQNIDDSLPHQQDRIMSVNRIVSELRMLLYSMREPLYAEPNEQNGSLVVKRAQRAIPIILDTANGSGRTRGTTNPVRVIREPEMKDL